MSISFAGCAPAGATPCAQLDRHAVRNENSVPVAASGMWRSFGVNARFVERPQNVARLAGAACLVVAVAITGCRTLLPRQYEYEEELYLALDGSATMYVNASVPALVALRGLELDPGARARVDRTRLRALYRVARDARDAHKHITAGRPPLRAPAHRGCRRTPARRGAAVRLVHVPIRPLGRRGHAYRQVVGRASGRDPGDVGWRGSEIVAFRMHLPSRIRYHDAPSKQVERGNILVWEQPLADRRAGRPLSIEARLDTQSILYRTVWLFGLMIVLVVALFAALLLWLVRRGPTHPPAAPA